MKNVITCSMKVSRTTLGVSIYKCCGNMGYLPATSNDEKPVFFEYGQWEEPSAQHSPYHRAFFKLNFIRAYINEKGKLPNLHLGWQLMWETHKDELSTDRRLLLDNLMKMMETYDDKKFQDINLEDVENDIRNWYQDVAAWAMLGLIVDF